VAQCVFIQQIEGFALDFKNRRCRQTQCSLSRALMSPGSWLNRCSVTGCLGREEYKRKMLEQVSPKAGKHDS
jgi:hypothetical protein